MKNSKKSIFFRTVSGLLAFLTVFALMASLSLVPVFADESSSSTRLFSDIYTDYYINPAYTDADAMKDGLTAAPNFTTPENRIAAMEPMLTKGNFTLYVDKISGEVALKDNSTGDIMFSNPYDISEYAISGTGSISKAVKPDLLSQINISYSDNGQQHTYNSFTDAALLGQITVKKLRGGVRVEYSIGEEETRNLVPRLMSEERYQEMIYSQLIANIPVAEGEIFDEYTNPIMLKATTFFEKIELKKTASQEYNDELTKQYPALKKYSSIRVFTGENYREIKQTERYIKMYCPKYTFEELDKDHMDMGYTSKDKAPANFRVALEYYLDDFGVQVRMPANGLSFDETIYELNSISILPYMGAGVGDYKGYTLIPDGSGTLMRFEDVERYFNVTGKVYGDDYSYQEISGSNQEVFRMPVFGVMTSNELINSSVSEKYPGYTAKEYSTGYVAIVTEGDALASITSLNGGGDRHPFNSAYCSFNPRPKDSYNLAEAISVGGDSKVTVVSERKYTGSFQINYIMLTDPAKQTDPDRNYYDTSYVGMAKAYRDYLEANGTISRLTEEDINKDKIPLYIEAFGVTTDDESFLSIPVTVKKAMTTFEQLKIMVEDCQAQGITNIGLKLTGYTNGGMYSTVPTKVKFEKSVGGNDGFTEFLEYAASKGVSVYPEFDFAYMSDTAAFDGFSYSSDAIKTIDNRYITKREYSAVLQTFATTGKICISPCVYRDYFESFNESFKKILGDLKTNVSLSTLGSDLNSDFDDDDPYNREDSKNFTLDLLKSFEVAGYGDIMINSGNAYAMQYADVVLNAPLDSSRYAYASESVPFFGMVYHGYVVFAGAPTNMAGDIQYETLKILENGATLYMMLSYDNVELLKEDEYLSKYYAVNYEIWKSALFGENGLYNKLNNALASVQTSRIDDHGFITCMRKFTDAELTNIRQDAMRYHDNGGITLPVIGEVKGAVATKAEYDKALNKKDIHFKYVLENKEALEAITVTYTFDSNQTTEGIYDNRELLEKLVDKAIAQNRAGYDEAWLQNILAYSTDEVVANYIVIKKIIEIAGVVGESDVVSKFTQAQGKYETQLSVLKSWDLIDIAIIYGELETAEAAYSVYVGEGENDSEMLTAIIEYLKTDYNSNRKIDDGTVVFVKYENGQYFILNYNSYVIEIEKSDLEAAGVDTSGFPEHIEIAPKDFYNPTEGGNA